jgi:hypothetical protein
MKFMHVVDKVPVECREIQRGSAYGPQQWSWNIGEWVKEPVVHAEANIILWRGKIGSLLWLGLEEAYKECKSCYSYKHVEDTHTEEHHLRELSPFKKAAVVLSENVSSLEIAKDVGALLMYIEGRVGSI